MQGWVRVIRGGVAVPDALEVAVGDRRGAAAALGLARARRIDVRQVLGLVLVDDEVPFSQ